MDKKRERSANFSISERDILISLVQKYKNAIENKQSDSATWKIKEAAWKSIEKEFNACSGGVLRNVKTLRIKYEGLKRLVRKKSALIRSELYRTGGGVNTAVPLDGVEEQIKDLIKLSTDGMESIYDSDILPQNQDGFNAQPTKDEELLPLTATDTECEKIESNDLPPVVQEVHVIETFLPPTAGEPTVENYTLDVTLENTPSLKYVPTPSKSADTKHDFTFTRKNLKSRKHAALLVTKKSQFDELTQAKLDLVHLQKKLLEAEIIEKRKEWEFKEKQRKWIEEEHKLKLEKLRRELND